MITVVLLTPASLAIPAIKACPVARYGSGIQGEAWAIRTKRLAQALCCWINHVGRSFQAAAKTKKPVAVRAITGPDGILK